MNLADSVLGRIDEAAKRGDWAGAALAAEQLLAFLAQGVLAGDVSLVDAVASDTASGATRVVLLGDVDATPGPVSTAWLMKAVAAFATIARDGMRRPEDGDTRSRIMRHLSAAGRTGLTNSDLVVRCERSAETISRILRRMVSDGEVERESAGRMVRNWAAGSRKAAAPATGRVTDRPRPTTSGDAGVGAVHAVDIVSSAGIASVDRHEAQPADNDAARILEALS